MDNPSAPWAARRPAAQGPDAAAHRGLPYLRLTAALTASAPSSVGDRAHLRATATTRTPKGSAAKKECAAQRLKVIPIQVAEPGVAAAQAGNETVEVRGSGCYLGDTADVLKSRSACRSIPAKRAASARSSPSKALAMAYARAAARPLPHRRAQSRRSAAVIPSAIFRLADMVTPISGGASVNHARYSLGIPCGPRVSSGVSRYNRCNLLRGPGPPYEGKSPSSWSRP